MAELSSSVNSVGLSYGGLTHGFSAACDTQYDRKDVRRRGIKKHLNYVEKTIVWLNVPNARQSDVNEGIAVDE